jgi:hypothetical protein
MMSCRDRPAVNRPLDLIDKEAAYRRHLSARRRAKSMVNTSRPETARRIVVVEKHAVQFRKMC